MRSLPLEVVHDINAVQPSFEAMIEKGRPGFQVDPGAGTNDEIRNKVTTSMQLYIPGFEFNQRTFSKQISGVDNELHLDAGLLGTGVAIHENVGLGYVALRLAKLGSVSHERQTLGKARERLSMRGPWHTGQLTDGMTTVFSEGFLTDKASLGPAFHHFTTRRGSRRSWARYTYSPPNL